MQMTGEFISQLDLGDIGEHDCIVVWSGYRPAVPAEDDYPEMEITEVRIDLCKSVLEVRCLLNDSALDNLKDQAWATFPTRDDLAAEAAEQLRTEQ